MKYAGVMGIVLVSALGCGSSSESTKPPVTTPDAGGATIQVAIAGLSGAKGKVVMVTTAYAGGAPATACFMVSADPFSYTDTLKVPGTADNPCAGGAVATFAAGTHTLSAGLYVPGSQKAEQCATFSVEVPASGSVTAALPALGACP